MTVPTPPTPADRWPRVKELAADILDLPAPAREDAARRACEGDAGLLEAVLTLVRAFENATSVFGDKGPPSGDLREALDHAVAPAGRLIARYRVLHRLGAGGMGSVFEAHDEVLGRPVALKLMHGPTSSPQARRRFQNESRLLALLRHPNIAQVYDTGIDASGPVPLAFLAMELVPAARTILEFARGQTTPPSRLASLLAEVADAVHHGHQRGVIHRDLKPGNILVDPEGRPKVIDFGVARLLGDEPHREPSAAGTARYMSPEQLASPSPTPDVLGDVYALGVVLLEVLTGRVLTPKTGPASPAEPDAPGVPRELLAIGRRACAHNPDDRYPSASELAADLRRFLQDRPTLALPVGWPGSVRLWARRHRVTAVAAGLATSALLLGLAGLSGGLINARQAQAEAQRQAQRSARIAGFLRSTILSASPQGRPTVSLPEGHPELWTFSPSPDPDPMAWSPAAPPGRLPSVPDLLAHATSHVGEAFPDDPELRAEVTRVLARALAATADARSTVVFRAAWQAAQEAYGERDTRTLDQRLAYLSVAALENPATVLEPTREAFRLALELEGPGSRRTLGAVHLLSSSLSSAGLGPEAGDIITDLKASIRATPGTHDREVLQLDLMLPPRTTDPAAELAVQRELVERSRRFAGPFSHELSQALLQTFGQLSLLDPTGEDLSTIAQERADIIRRLHGPETPEMVDALADVYRAAMQRPDLVAAEVAAREQVRICSTSLGPDSLYTPKALGRLARVLTERGVKLEEAERLAREASVRSDAFWTTRDAWSIFHHAAWAEAVRLQGDPARAEAMLRARRAQLDPAWPTRQGGWELLYEATVMADCLIDVARPDEAATELQHARDARARYASPTPSFDRLIARAAARLARGDSPAKGP